MHVWITITEREFLLLGYSVNADMDHYTREGVLVDRLSAGVDHDQGAELLVVMLSAGWINIKKGSFWLPCYLQG